MSTTGQVSGRVKWFSAIKGYGFIQVDGIQQDVFVHFSEISMDGYKTLHDDHAVLLHIEWTDKGPIAKAVESLQPVSSAGSEPLRNAA